MGWGVGNHLSPDLGIGEAFAIGMKKFAMIRGVELDIPAGTAHPGAYLGVDAIFENESVGVPFVNELGTAGKLAAVVIDKGHFRNDVG